MATEAEGWANVRERLDALLAWASPEYAAADTFAAQTLLIPKAAGQLASKLGRPSLAKSVAAVAQAMSEKGPLGFGPADAELATVEAYAREKGYKQPVARLQSVVEPGGFFGWAERNIGNANPPPVADPMKKAARVALAVAIAAGVSLAVMLGMRLGQLSNKGNNQ